ncbi:MAG: sodium:solute symporter [Christensenellales bacterium]
MEVQILIIVVYSLLLIVIGFIANKKTKTMDDFVLGGRKIGAWMSALSYGTTYFSAVIFVGYAGRFGWSVGVAVTWIGIANAIIGTWLAWKLLAKPTRRITQRLNSATMPDFFFKRYNSQGLKITAAIIIFVFLVPYCASVYQGIGYFSETVLKIPYEYCMIGMAVLTAIYLIAGGYIATALTNFVQAIVMAVGVILMVLFIIGAPQVGGLSEGLSRIAAIPGEGASLASPFGSPDTLVILISLTILTSLGTWGLPQMVHKFYAIKDKRAITRGTVISTVFAFLVGGIAYFIGGFGRLFLTEAPADLDMVMPQVLGLALPPVLLGLILVLLLAASMSTLSSLVLVSSTAISLDLAKGVMRPKMKDKNVMSLTRALCALFVLVSVFIALFKPAAIVTLMSYSWGAISGCFLAPFLLGVRWKGMTKAGAWAGIVTGLAVSIPLMILNILKILPGWMSAPTIGSMAMLLSLIVTPVVSIMSKKFDNAHINRVFGNGDDDAQAPVESAETI